MSKVLTLRDVHGQYRVAVGDEAVSVDGHPVRAGAVGAGLVRVGEPSRPAWIAVEGDTRWVFLDGRVYRFEAVRARGQRKAGVHHGSLAAPMPATVRRVQTAAGDSVKRGDTLLVLEAMKMELPVRAPADGVVTAVHCREGDMVAPGTSLIEMDEVENGG
jgi:3-methylcrotonyl-CoA carboxylase alpha subunit